MPLYPNDDTPPTRIKSSAHTAARIGGSASAPIGREFHGPHPLWLRSAPADWLREQLAAHGAIGSVRMLLARGAQPELVDGDGRLPVAHALHGVPGHSLPGEGHAECHALLLRHLAR